jgi:hypothetical protein
MLAGLLTVALLASANAIELKTKPSLKEITSASHLKMTKTFRKRNTKVLPSAIATTSTTSGVAKYYVEEGASSSSLCSGDATSYFYDGYGMCLTNYDGTTMMSMYMEENDGSYNITETYFSDAECATPVTSTSTMFPGSCSSALEISSGTYAYVMSLGKFKEDSKTFGTKSFNSDTDCADDDDSKVISASAAIMGVCYPIEISGVTYYFTVQSCGKITPYSDADCKTKINLDDGYGDDDDDDDDDAYSLECVEKSGTGATPEEWESDYCKSAASSVSVASVAMVAGSALAAFAMM